MHVMTDIYPGQKFGKGTSLVHYRENHSEQENNQMEETKIPEEIALWEETSDMGRLEQKTIHFNYKLLYTVFH